MQSVGDIASSDISRGAGRLCFGIKSSIHTRCVLPRFIAMLREIRMIRRVMDRESLLRGQRSILRFFAQMVTQGVRRVLGCLKIDLSTALPIRRLLQTCLLWLSLHRLDLILAYRIQSLYPDYYIWLLGFAFWTVKRGQWCSSSFFKFRFYEIAKW